VAVESSFLDLVAGFFWSIVVFCGLAGSPAPDVPEPTPAPSQAPQ
jgi:hypothetical protein